MAQDAESAVAPRFAESEQEDAAILASQEEEFEDALDMDEDAIDESDESEVDADLDENDEEEEQTEEDSEEEAEEETEDEAEEESEEESDEEEEEADENEEDSEEDSEEEESDFVLAELQDNPKFTGLLQMTATFVPTEAAEAAHLVHSLSSHQQALAHQQYTAGYHHGAADAAAAQAAPTLNEGEEEDEEAEEGEEASFVEASGSPRPVYGFPGQFPNGLAYTTDASGHAFAARPYYTSVAPPPPPMPTWLPPPPYVPPVAAADKE